MQTSFFSLRITLITVGLIFTFGIYPLTFLWSSGWAWGHGHSHYLMMIIGVYATLGVFLLLASSDPYAHKSLIWFTVWSSVVHAAIMGVQSFNDPMERGHPLGDVPALGRSGKHWLYMNLQSTRPSMVPSLTPSVKSK